MLEIKNLCVAVDGKEILKGINLIINAGETHAVHRPHRCPLSCRRHGRSEAGQAGTAYQYVGCGDDGDRLRVGDGAHVSSLTSGVLSRQPP